MTTAKLTFDMDRPCRRCKKKGAGAGGYCLKCVVKMLGEGKFDHILKRRGHA